MRNQNPSQEFIDYICNLYDDVYDDRIENTAPPTAGDNHRNPGDEWIPGITAKHKSLGIFQRELAEQGIKLSTSKIKKILITGGLWTTARSREIAELFKQYTVVNSAGGEYLPQEEAIKRIAKDLKVSIVTVDVNLPYMNVVYNLENRSSNAKRCARYKKRKRIAAELSKKS